MKKQTHLWLNIAIAAVILILLLLAPTIIHNLTTIYNNYYPQSKISAGEFGDQYGVLNTLFSALAFFVIYLSLLTQRDELKLQREEIKLARIEHEKQNFDSQLLFILRNLNEQMSMVSGKFNHIDKINTTKHSIDYFEELYRNILLLHDTIKETEFENINFENASTEAKLLSFYNITNKDIYNSLKEDVNFFSNQLIKRIKRHRIREFHFLQNTYNITIKMLMDSYDERIRNTEKGIDVLTINKQFDIYISMIKSAVPRATRLVLLYVNTSEYGMHEKHYVTDFIYSDIHSSSYIEPEHYIILYPNKG